MLAAFLLARDDGHCTDAAAIEVPLLGHVDSAPCRRVGNWNAALVTCGERVLCIGFQGILEMLVSSFLLPLGGIFVSRGDASDIIGRPAQVSLLWFVRPECIDSVALLFQSWEHDAAAGDDKR